MQASGRSLLDSFSVTLPTVQTLNITSLLEVALCEVSAADFHHSERLSHSIDSVPKSFYAVHNSDVRTTQMLTVMLPIHGTG